MLCVQFLNQKSGICVLQSQYPPETSLSICVVYLASSELLFLMDHLAWLILTSMQSAKMLITKFNTHMTMMATKLLKKLSDEPLTQSMILCIKASQSRQKNSVLTSWTRVRIRNKTKQKWNLPSTDKRHFLSPKNASLIHFLTMMSPESITIREIKLRIAAIAYSCLTLLNQSQYIVHLSRLKQSHSLLRDLIHYQAMNEVNDRLITNRTVYKATTTHFMFLILVSKCGNLWAALLSLKICLSKYRGTVKLARRYCNAKRQWIVANKGKLVIWERICMTNIPPTQFES